MNQTIATLRFPQDQNAGFASQVLMDNTLIFNKLLEACHKQGLSVLNSVKHEFSPMGMTAVVLLAESHVAIHTWPEKRELKMDVFTCGDTDSSSVAEAFADLVGAKLGYRVLERKAI